MRKHARNHLEVVFAAGGELLDEELLEEELLDEELLDVELQAQQGRCNREYAQRRSR